MRSNAGIAWPIGTESKNDFIQDLTKNIINSLDRFDIKATVIDTKSNEDEKAIKIKLLNANGDKKYFLFLMNCILMVMQYKFCITK